VRHQIRYIERFGKIIISITLFLLNTLPTTVCGNHDNRNILCGDLRLQFPGKYPVHRFPGVSQKLADGEAALYKQAENPLGDPHKM